MLCAGFLTLHGGNSKSEYRNPKKIKMFQCSNRFVQLGFESAICFEFSCIGFRIWRINPAEPLGT